MITRYAIFEGDVSDGKEAEMRIYVLEQLAPLWRQFACAKDVQVLFGVQQDPDGPTIPLMLAITYENADDMAKALDSPARYVSKDLLPAFYKRYFNNVRLYHYVMERHRFTAEM